MGQLRFRTAPHPLPGGAAANSVLTDTVDAIDALSDSTVRALDAAITRDDAARSDDDRRDDSSSDVTIAPPPPPRSSGEGDTELRLEHADRSLPTDWADALSQAYVTGYDGRVFPTTISIDPDASSGPLLVCRRPVGDSGKLRVPWPVAGRGLRVLTTSSLRERDEPYDLAVELARGLLGELRNQAAAWHQSGMILPASYLKAEDESFRWFAKAACRTRDDADEAAGLAQRAIESGCRASDELMRAYTVQKLANRKSRPGQLPVVLGCGLEDVPAGSERTTPVSGEEDTDLVDAPAQPAEAFAQAFSAASIPMHWPDVEPAEGQADWSAIDPVVDWAEDRGLLLQGGPLLDFRPGGLPAWLQTWSVDEASFQSFLCDYVEFAKARYRGRVKFWSLAIGACTGGAFGLTEEQRLTLVARLLEAARGSDDDSQVFLEIDEPWGEYQSAGHHRIAPLQFVDAIARSNLGLEGLVLRLDLTADGGLARYRLLADTSRLVDQWSLFGLPLHIRLIVPTDQIDAPHWLSDQLPLLMAKPAVTAVFWSRYQDTATLSTGAITVSGEAKPTHTVFANHHRQNR